MSPSAARAVSLKAYAFLTITTALWGGNAVVGKLAVGHVSPLTLSLLRWGLALIAICLISLPQLKADWPLIRRYWLRMAGFGVMGFAGFNALLYTALTYTTAVNVAIEQAGIPGLIFLANYLLFRTRVQVAQIAGFAITLLGVGVTATHGSLAALMALDFNFGDGLMMLAIIAYAGYTVSLRFKPPVHWKSLMAATAFGAVLACIPMALWEAWRGTMIWPDSIGWMAVLYTGLLPSLVSQVLYVRGVEMIGPNRAGLFINAIPVFGMLFSVLFLGEPLFGFHFVAMALVLAGIILAERGRK